eukprot:g3602.t1
MFFRLFGVRVPPSSSRDAARRNVERTSSMALGDWDEVAVGKYVYWSNVQDDVPLADLGEVLSADGSNRVVRFAKKEVKDKEGNGLTANRTDLLKSQLQPGSRVRWTISSDDIPRGELGEVLLDVNAYSDIKVKFSAGEFRMRYSEMVLASECGNSITVGQYVYWSNVQDGVPLGDLGETAAGRLREACRSSCRIGSTMRWAFQPMSRISRRTARAARSGAPSSADFSSGYLFGEILHKFWQADFEQFQNKNSHQAKIANFKSLEPILKALGIKFNATLINAVMNGERGAALRQWARRSIGEVKVLVEVADATGPAELPSEPIACGIAYLDHMLDQLNSHGQLRVSVQDGEAHVTQMMGIGLQCNCPRKPDEDLEAKLPDLQHVRPSNQLLEKNHVDAAPLFEWVNSECPILQGELFDWDDQRRQTRRSYYDLRLDPKQGGAGEPNRALHDFKACELKSFVRKAWRAGQLLRPHSNDAFVQGCDSEVAELVGSALGAALRQMLDERRPSGSFRFLVPLDEALTDLSLDFSEARNEGSTRVARASVEIALAPFGAFPPAGRQRIGSFRTALTEVILRRVAEELKVGLKVKKLRGDNAHHIVEATFKSFARCLRRAMDAASGLVNGGPRFSAAVLGERRLRDAAADGRRRVATGFHTLDALLRRLGSGLQLTASCVGDAWIDEHHSVEDVMITVGQALHQALGSKAGCCRMAFAEAAYQSAQVLCVMDLSNRPMLCSDLQWQGQQEEMAEDVSAAKDEWEARGHELWQENMKVRMTRENEQMRFSDKVLRTQQEKELTLRRQAAEEVLKGTQDFESGLVTLGLTKTKEDVIPEDSSEEETDSVEKLLAQTSKVASAKELVEALQAKLPTGQELNYEANLFMRKIKELHRQLQEMLEENQLEQVLLEKLGRESIEDCGDWRVNMFEEVFVRNRQARQQQYIAQKRADKEEALKRDQDERERVRYRAVERLRHAKRREKLREEMEGILELIVQMSFASLQQEQLTDQEEVDCTLWREWVSLFEENLPVMSLPSLQLCAEEPAPLTALPEPTGLANLHAVGATLNSAALRDFMETKGQWKVPLTDEATEPEEVEEIPASQPPLEIFDCATEAGRGSFVRLRCWRCFEKTV